MDDMVRDACLSLYTDNNTISIMYNKNAEFYNVYGRLLKLQQLVNTTPYLHSIYIYNNISKLYYTTDKGIVKSDEYLESINALNVKYTVLKPVLMNVKGSGSDGERVFSYFMFDSLDDEKRMNGALILNVKSAWLFDNVQLENGFAAKKHDRLFLWTTN